LGGDFRSPLEKEKIKAKHELHERPALIAKKTRLITCAKPGGGETTAKVWGQKKKRSERFRAGRGKRKGILPELDGRKNCSKKSGWKEKRKLNRSTIGRKISQEEGRDLKEQQLGGRRKEARLPRKRKEGKTSQIQSQPRC